MTNKNTYWTKALKSRDPRFAQVLSRLGYATRHMQADIAAPVVAAPASEPTPEVGEELADLRAQYQEIVGKKPYYGWDVDELRKRINEALAS